MRRHRHRQLGNTEYLQKIILFFLIGFFIGGSFYYIFQSSFNNICQRLEENLNIWTKDKASTVILIGKNLWQHGKYFLLFFIFAIGPLANIYQKAFSIYTGIRNGFLLMFFLFAKGAFGLVVYFVSFFPQGLLFVPLYLYLFGDTNKSKQGRRQVIQWILILLVFVTACVLEVKVNLPIMKSVL